MGGRFMNGILAPNLRLGVMAADGRFSLIALGKPVRACTEQVVAHVMSNARPAILVTEVTEPAARRRLKREVEADEGLMLVLAATDETAGDQSRTTAMAGLETVIGQPVVYDDVRARLNSTPHPTPAILEKMTREAAARGHVLAGRLLAEATTRHPRAVVAWEGWQTLTDELFGGRGRRAHALTEAIRSEAFLMVQDAIQTTNIESTRVPRRLALTVNRVLSGIVPFPLEISKSWFSSARKRSRPDIEIQQFREKLLHLANGYLTALRLPNDVAPRLVRAILRSGNVSAETLQLPDWRARVNAALQEVLEQDQGLLVQVAARSVADTDQSRTGLDELLGLLSPLEVKIALMVAARLRSERIANALGVRESEIADATTRITQLISAWLRQR
jgi:hypothetical protein